MCARASGGGGGERERDPTGGACTERVCGSETERERIKRSVRRASESELVCVCVCVCVCVREREGGTGGGEGEKREGYQFFFHLAAIRSAGFFQKQIHSENLGGILDMQPPPIHDIAARHAAPPARTFTETQP
jgi:hypothetical protein